MNAPSAENERAALLCQAAQKLECGDDGSAEPLLARVLLTHPEEPYALYMLGFLRRRQNNLDAAASLFARSLAAQPLQPQAQLDLGHIFAAQGRLDEAIDAFHASVKLKPDFAEALFALGDSLHDAGRLDEAEQIHRKLLQLVPGHVPAKLNLSAVLIDAGRPAEAEAVARLALAEASDTQQIANLEQNLALALDRQNRAEEALDCYERAQQTDSGLTHLDHRRATLFERAQRFDEALVLFRRVLAREPLNLAVHLDYNHLLYRLGRDEEFLGSYDEAAARAPQETQLPLAKAAFLLKAERAEEAYEIYRQVRARDPQNPQASAGAGVALARMKCFESAFACFEAAMLSQPGNAGLYGDAAAVLAQMREPQKTAAMAIRGLGVNPHDQVCLALLGTAWRMMDDARAEALAGYTKLIRVFDLEPPAGFSDMGTFNAELNAYLDQLHPPTREFVDQSLRGGTQTANNIFGAGHELVERLRARIAEAIDRYIIELAPDTDHPFLGRRRRGFIFTGSWSSRLRDCGFHVNHLHPRGWISSCYYVSVPDAVADVGAKPGWIKFGEPCYDVGLADPVARTIQPAPGRLVLFPSYTWHGTVPFRSPAARTTIAFDAIPA